MHTVLAVAFGLIVSAPLVAESLVEGWVRQSSGEPVEAAQVLVFDWTDLQRGPVAQATTDAAGYFALPSLGGSVLPQAWTLGQNYPNPFNPSTIIHSALDGSPSWSLGGRHIAFWSWGIYVVELREEGSE